MMPQKCAHGNFYTSPCRACGRERGISPLGPKTPKLAHGAWDKSWYELRTATHARLRKLFHRIDAAPWDEKAYYEVFDTPRRALSRRGVRYLEADHDPATLGGALYLALVPIVDITFEDDTRKPPTLHRYQACNDKGEWIKVRDIIEHHDPASIRERVADGRIKIHGGNGAWSAQQRQPDFFKADPEALREIIRLVIHGDDGVPPEHLGLDRVSSRIRLIQRRATELGVAGVSLGRCSKFLNIAAPKQWPVFNTRANPDVAKTAGFEIPKIRPGNPDDYALWTEFCRKVAIQRADPDLGMTDIAFSNTYDSQTEDDD